MQVLSELRLQFELSKVVRLELRPDMFSVSKSYLDLKLWMEFQEIFHGLSCPLGSFCFSRRTRRNNIQLIY